MMKRTTLKKGDLLVMTVAVLLAVVFVLLYFLRPKTVNGTAEVTVDGALYGVYPLSQPRTVTVQTSDGAYNTLLIADGAVQVSDADCPDRLCVRQGAVSRRGEAIICLPHGLVITVRDGAEADADFVSR